MPKIKLLINPLILLVVSCGCVQKAPENTYIEMKSIEQTVNNGVYKITGITNLPDSSQISVAAVRSLHSTQSESSELSDNDANKNRSILTRQIVEIKQGQWQTDLNLWQIASDGSVQEAWQANQEQLNLSPDSNVTFIATFAPADQLQKSDQQSSQQPGQENKKLEGKLVYFTNEGEAYIQASKILSVPVPVRKTTPSPHSKNVNEREKAPSQIKSQSTVSRVILLPPTKFRQTNAPLKPGEFLR